MNIKIDSHGKVKQHSMLIMHHAMVLFVIFEVTHDLSRLLCVFH